MGEFLEEFLRPQVAAALEDCVNQLAVLGGVAPAAVKDGGESTKLVNRPPCANALLHAGFARLEDGRCRAPQPLLAGHRPHVPLRVHAMAVTIAAPFLGLMMSCCVLYCCLVARWRLNRAGGGKAARVGSRV